jgi:hypothetical protein
MADIPVYPPEAPIWMDYNILLYNNTYGGGGLNITWTTWLSQSIVSAGCCLD